MKADSFSIEGVTLAYGNAISKNKEARLLFDGGHFLRSIVLSITSMEERVKA